MGGSWHNILRFFMFLGFLFLDMCLFYNVFRKHETSSLRREREVFRSPERDGKGVWNEQPLSKVIAKAQPPVIFFPLSFSFVVFSSRIYDLLSINLSKISGNKIAGVHYINILLCHPHSAQKQPSSSLSVIFRGSIQAQYTIGSHKVRPWKVSVVVSKLVRIHR